MKLITGDPGNSSWIPVCWIVYFRHKGQRVVRGRYPARVAWVSRDQLHISDPNGRPHTCVECIVEHGHSLLLIQDVDVVEQNFTGARFALADGVPLIKAIQRFRPIKGSFS